MEKLLMPTYEYECGECKHRFEVFQSIHDDPIKKCVSCGRDVKKLFSSTGIIFKGSGFYVNDYKKKDADPSSPKIESPAKAAVS
jgi:putative FmdB family regulatory protein